MASAAAPSYPAVLSLPYSRPEASAIPSATSAGVGLPSRLLHPQMSVLVRPSSMNPASLLVISALLFAGCAGKASRAVDSNQSSPPVAAEKAGNGRPVGGALGFRGTEFRPRWSNGTQSEFTPAGQEDLRKWTDMITLIRYPTVRNGGALAQAAQTALRGYEQSGATVIRTASVAKPGEADAEYLIIALFPQPDFIEAAFARFALVNRTGSSVVYSHRIYGKPVGEAMVAWLAGHGSDIEKELMGWNGIRSRAP